MILLVGLWPAYNIYDRHHSKTKAQQSAMYALATAKVWLATALFRDDPERFLTYRDSLLAENGLSNEKMIEYLNMYEKQPERHDVFVRLVGVYIDSLYNLGFSELRQLNDTVETMSPKNST